MFNLDDDFLRDCGLEDLPSEDKQSLLQHIYIQLELKVGTALTDACSLSQLEAFEEMIDRGASEDELAAWLRTDIPDYQEAVSAAWNDIKNEVTSQAQYILKVVATRDAP